MKDRRSSGETKKGAGFWMRYNISVARMQITSARSLGKKGREHTQAREVDQDSDNNKQRSRHTINTNTNSTQRQKDKSRKTRRIHTHPK